MHKFWDIVISNLEVPRVCHTFSASALSTFQKASFRKQLFTWGFKYMQKYLQSFFSSYKIILF